MIYLIIGALVTFYSYNLLSMVLEHYASKGLRFLRFQDMADHILGKTNVLGPKFSIFLVHFSDVQYLIQALAESMSII